MFDFVKLEMVDEKLYNDLLSNELLIFSTPVNEKTGEILEDKKTASYYNLKFSVYSSYRIFVTGSIHVFYSLYHYGIKANYCEFSYTECNWVLTHLEKTFKIDLSKAAVRNLEFGINFHFKERSDLLQAITKFITFKSFPFTRVLNSKKRSFNIEFNNYEIKVYDKSIQCRLKDAHILRIEKKVTRMIEISPCTIYLDRLLDKDFWRYWFRELEGVINHCTIVEIPDYLRKGDKLMKELEKYSNPIFWEMGDRRSRYYHKVKLNQIYTQLSFKTIQTDFIQIINENKELLGV